MDYVFDWDPKKASLNLSKHSVGFERAATIFMDPRAVSIADEEHSEKEERWVTVGLDAAGNLLVVVHTFEEKDPTQCKIHLISARKATKKERGQYGTER